MTSPPFSVVSLRPCLWRPSAYARAQYPRSCRGFLAVSERSCSSDQRLVGEPLACRAIYEAFQALQGVALHIAIIEPESELPHLAVKVLLAHMMERAVDAALQNRPNCLDAFFPEGVKYVIPQYYGYQLGASATASPTSHPSFPRAGGPRTRQRAVLAPGDVVTVTRIDRLARSTFDLFAIVKQIVDAKAQFRPSRGRHRHQHRALDARRTRRLGRRGARSNPHPHRRGQEPRQGPRAADGPTPGTHSGTADRGYPTPSAGRYVARIGRQLRRGHIHHSARDPRDVEWHPTAPRLALSRWSSCLWLGSVWRGCKSRSAFHQIP